MQIMVESDKIIYQLEFNKIHPFNQEKKIIIQFLTVLIFYLFNSTYYPRRMC